MRWWIPLVGMLASVGTMGCGTHLPGTSPSANRAAQDAKATGGRTGEVHVEKRRMLELEEWKEGFAKQQEKNQWPSVLSGEFHQWIRNHPTDAVIPPRFREAYVKTIQEHVVQLGEVIDRRHGPPGIIEGIVDWNESDFARLANEVYWTTCPTTVDIRIAQEDMWAYEAILRAIAQSNEDAGTTSYDNAAIKRIQTLEISQPATVALVAACRDKSKWSFDPLVEYDGEYDSEEWSAEEEHDWTDPEWVNIALRTGRYVNLENEPLAADSQPYVEFNLLPVHIELVMAPQRVPNLLFHLANSHMPFEVKHLRIDGERQNVSSALKGDIDTPEAAQPTDGDRNNPLPVEFVGTLRIYNPPPPTP